MQPRAHFSIWYVVGAFVLIIVLQMLLVWSKIFRLMGFSFPVSIRHE